jgi:hypothetical protein
MALDTPILSLSPSQRLHYLLALGPLVSRDDNPLSLSLMMFFYFCTPTAYHHIIFCVLPHLALAPQRSEFWSKPLRYHAESGSLQDAVVLYMHYLGSMRHPRRLRDQGPMTSHYRACLFRTCYRSCRSPRSRFAHSFFMSLNFIVPCCILHTPMRRRM